MGYSFKVRCGKCNSIYATALSSRHYNSFESYVCEECGSNGCFYNSTEKFVSTGTLLKPWTWFEGYYVNNKGEIIKDDNDE